jgi:hypothetical protein
MALADLGFAQQFFEKGFNVGHGVKADALYGTSIGLMATFMLCLEYCDSHERKYRYLHILNTTKFSAWEDVSEKLSPTHKVLWSIFIPLALLSILEPTVHIGLTGYESFALLPITAALFGVNFIQKASLLRDYHSSLTQVIFCLALLSSAAAVSLAGAALAHVSFAEQFFDTAFNAGTGTRATALSATTLVSMGSATVAGIGAYRASNSLR